MSNKPLSGLFDREQDLTGADLMLISQLTAAGWKSAQVTLEDFFTEMFQPTSTAGQLVAGIRTDLDDLENRFNMHENPALNTTDPNYDPHAGFYLREVTKLASNSGLAGDGRISNPMSVNFSYLDTLYVNANSRSVNTGAGLIGGGNLSADRTISMGPPSSITSGSSNSASGDTHSHELAPGAVTNAKLANNSVTDEKIQSVSASKITGIIPSANLPPASATINVIDNLTSNSVNDALSANQGRVLAGQLVNKLNLSGGTLTGNLNIGQTNLDIGGGAYFPGFVAIDNSLDVLHMTNAKGGLWADKINIKQGGFGGVLGAPSNDPTVHGSISIFGKKLYFNVIGTDAIGHAFDNPIILEDNAHSTTISHGIVGDDTTKFTTNNDRYLFDKDVYFGRVQKAASGYATLPNGLIMQWGRNTADANLTNGGSGNGIGAFPIAFPNACISFQIEKIGSHTEVYNGTVFTAKEASTTHYSYIWKTSAGQYIGDYIGIYWMAIGY